MTAIRILVVKEYNIMISCRPDSILKLKYFLKAPVCLKIYVEWLWCSWQLDTLRKIGSYMYSIQLWLNSFFNSLSLSIQSAILLTGNNFSYFAIPSDIYIDWWFKQFQRNSELNNPNIRVLKILRSLYRQ